MKKNIALKQHLPDESADSCRRTRTQGLAKSEKCAYSFTWNLLGKRWTFLIITKLLVHSQSFHELFNHIQGISETVLSQRLKELEQGGVLQRQVHPEYPIRVTYHLTAKGEALESVIRAIDTWSQCL
jgi:DNA-binding HxlR family transcriptional regulator